MVRKSIDAKVAEAAERLKQLKAIKAKQEARERAEAKKRERAEDTNRKIRLGGLAVLAGLADADKGFVLGVLLDGAQRQSDLQFVARCKAMGDDLLAKQAAENNKSAAAQSQG